MRAFSSDACESAVEEVKQRWGSTAAYAEYADKTSAYTEEAWDTVTAGLMAVFAEFAGCRKTGESAESEAAQSLVKQLQAYITNHFYTCTQDILAGLGLMYVEDERFRSNIDRYGEGTAAFACDAIRYYCGRG